MAHLPGVRRSFKPVRAQNVNGAQITKPARASDRRADPWVGRLFGVGGRGNPSDTGGFPTTTTTTTTRSVPTSTTLITLKGVGPQLNNKRAILSL